MDFQHFIDIGERLNLEGPQLHAFVEKELDKIRIKEEAAAAREDRAAERTALKEENERIALKEAAERVALKEECERLALKETTEREHLALKESEERRMQHEKDMAAIHLESDRARADSLKATARDMNQSRASLPKTHMLPRFKESDGNIDAYLQRFERYAENEGWSFSCYAIYISALLEGTALEVYHRLPTSDANNYEIVKAALLKKYSLTGDDYRNKLFSSRANTSENASQFFARLEHFLNQWICLSKIDLSFDALRDLLLGEQFLHSCSRELAVFIRERTPSNISEMMNLANIFSDSRIVTGGKDATPAVLPTTGNNSPRNQGNESLRTNPRPTREPLRCFLCNTVGHKAISCPTGRPVRNPNAPYSRGPVFANASLTMPMGRGFALANTAGPEKVDQVVIACGGTATTGNFRDLPLVGGSLNGVPVRILRDTGCTGLLVRQNLIDPATLTGSKALLIKVDSSQEVTHIARCTIESPVFSGIAEVLFVPSLVCDVVVGNVPGAYPDMRDFMPVDTPHFEQPIKVTKLTPELPIQERSEMVGTVKTRYNSSDVVDSDEGIVCATAAILDTATDESFDVSSLLGDRPESIDDVKWHDRLSSDQKKGGAITDASRGNVC